MKIVFENEDEFKSVVWNTEGEINYQEQFLKEMVSGFPIELTDVEIKNGIIQSASRTITPTLNRFIMNIGDWSNDGHEKTEQVIIETDLSLEEIQNAYKRASVEMGFALHPRHDSLPEVKYHTGGKHTHSIDRRAWDYFVKAYNLFGEGWDQEDYEINSEIYALAFVIMVKHVRNDAIVRIFEGEKLEHINGFWSDNLNSGFGYELFMEEW